MPAVKTKIGSGSECTVYDVGNGRCYKEYFDADYVEGVYENAKMAAEAGIAPEVYERDEHGYYTEIVEVFDCDCISPYTAIDDGIIDKGEFNILQAKLIEVFGSFNDLRMPNIGCKDGKLVAIDFGAYST